ncbi:MAG TPA: SulP family inorganic anion transporter [Phycisphaerae bacterium]|nr:SulP family inorganic anion transporter [Phycisphaerae bacterium]
MPPALPDTPKPEPQPSAASFLSRITPGLHAAFGGGPAAIRSDLIAAVTLAAYLLPSNIGDATLAGLPPEAGLYACLFSGLVFWIFCSSQHTTITVTSAISLLIGTSLGGLAGGDPTRFWALASCTCLIVGAMAFIAWALRAGALVNFISETVLIGFKAGVALHLTSTQLPKLFGFKGSHGDFWERMGWFFTHLHETNPLALTFGLAALAILVAGKVFLKNKPVALFVMIAGILIASIVPMSDRGVSLLGEIPHGLPHVQLPPVELHDLNDLLPLAMACFMLAAVETAAIGRTFALKYRYKLDINQELLAIAAANIAAGFGRGYPVSGGMSQSLVNESAGGRSPLSGFGAACIVLLVAVFLSGLLRNLPQPVLAAIVLVAVTGLFKISSLKRLWHFNRAEFFVAMAALAGVLCSGLLRGVLIGAVLSIIILLRRGSRPHTTQLGRVPGSQYFADAIRHQENTLEPGIFVFRVDSSLLYFNVDYVRDRFFELLNERTDNIRLAIFYLGTTPFVDIAGADLLLELAEALNARNITFRLAEAHGQVRDALRRAGLEDHTGIHANETVSEIVAAALAQA